jgi:DNA-binding NtrC family response regulator
MTTILLVDDDPLQGSVRKSILEKKFPNVRRVVDAAEALCLVEENPAEVDLGVVVSGHQMPGIGASEFVSELHIRRPSLPVLVLGEAGDDPSDYQGDRIYYLPMPVTPEDMLKTASLVLV